MKNLIYISVLSLVSVLSNYAMEETKQENFGDHQNTVNQSPSPQVNIDITKIKQEDAKKKKKKKIKKDSAEKQLKELEEGVNYDEIDKHLIAKLKIYRDDISEAVIQEELEELRNAAVEKYNDLQHQLLENSTQTRVLSTKEEEQNGSNNSIIQELILLQKQQVAANKFLGSIEKKKLDAEIKRNSLHEAQIKEMKQTNTNMGNNYKLSLRSGVASLLVTLAVAIGGYFH